VWERIPFQRTPFGEDLIWADSVLRGGYTIVFDPEAVVIHSHEYRPGSIYSRTHIDGWLNRAYFRRYCMEKLSHVFIMTLRQFHGDRRFLKAKKLPLRTRMRECFTSLAYHFFEFYGFYMGGRTHDRLYPVLPCAARPLRILFPLSDSTLKKRENVRSIQELAQCLIQQGHRVSFLHGGGSSKPGGFTQDDGEGVPTYRVGFNPMDEEIDLGQPLPRLEKALEAVFESASPDVVHLQDFRAFTSGVMEFCHARGFPAVVTLKDLWFRCPQGDLVRPDGNFCSNRHPPGLGCIACRANQPEFVFLAGQISGLARKGFCKISQEPSARKASPKRGEFAKRMGYLMRMDEMRKRLNQAEFVLVPSPFIKAKSLEAGLDPKGVIPVRYGGDALPLEKTKESLEFSDSAMASLLSHSNEEQGVDSFARVLIVKYQQAISNHKHKREAMLQDDLKLCGRVEGRSGSPCHT
jgi:hypothetical protein